MSHHVLAIDVGNSRIKAGLVATSAGPGTLPACDASIALPIAHENPSAALSDWLATQSIAPRCAFVGGVNPQVIASIVEQNPIGERCPVIHIERPSGVTLVNRTLQPERVGPDRLFDAVAANLIRPEGRSAVIVDSGTATTVDLVDASGAFRGGAIVAGFELVAAALHERTALLPKIDVAEIGTPDPLGRDTAEALRSGLYWTLVGGVKELVATAIDGGSRTGRDGSHRVAHGRSRSDPRFAPAQSQNCILI